MSKKRTSAKQGGAPSEVRDKLPQDLTARLQSAWQSLGHLIEWCDSYQAWTQLFCSEARPYRETFYWESIARMVSDYMRQHPAASPESALTECLIATQCPPSAHDDEALMEFRTRWQEILDSSQEAMEAFIQSDLELARQEDRYDAVAALYAAEPRPWRSH